MALAGRFGNLPWMFEPLFEPMVSRFEQWLEGVEAFERPFWRDDGDNDTLFRLGLGLVIGMERGARDRARALAERLLALDGEDSLGFRELLIEQLLGDGQNERALWLIEQVRETDGEVSRWLGLLLGRALALYRLGRLEPARKALVDIEYQNPWMLRLLVQESPRRERHGREAPQAGSRAEAWQYRVLMRGQWVTTPGALDWLDAHLRARGRGDGAGKAISLPDKPLK